MQSFESETSGFRTTPGPACAEESAVIVTFASNTARLRFKLKSILLCDSVGTDEFKIRGTCQDPVLANACGTNKIDCPCAGRQYYAEKDMARGKRARTTFFSPLLRPGFQPAMSLGWDRA